MLGQVVGSRYRIFKHLGGGSFGQTYLAEDAYIPEDNLCVVKQLKPQFTDPLTLQVARRLFESEAKTLHKLGNHGQIPRLLAHFEEKQDFYLVQEFIEGHDLSRELLLGKRWSEVDAIKLVWDILEVLSFVHQHQVIHRDLKPSNIRRRQRDGKLVLIDFGAVKQISTQVVTSQGKTMLTVAVGTMGYAPNELLSGKPRLCSDIYAVGMMGIQALTGMYPAELRDDPTTGELVWRDGINVSPEFSQILDGMVCYDFRQRYQTTQEVMRALEPLMASTESQRVAPPLVTQPPEIMTVPTAPVSLSGLPLPPTEVNLQLPTLPEPDSAAVPVAAASSVPETEVVSVDPASAQSSPDPVVTSSSAPTVPVTAPPSVPPGMQVEGMLGASVRAASSSSPPTVPLTEPPSPPVQVPPTVASPPSEGTVVQSPHFPWKFLGVGAGVAAAIATTVVGLNYYNQSQRQFALGQITSLKMEGNHEECVRTAMALSGDAQAQQLLGECQLARAQALAASNRLKDAILAANEIAEGHSAHEESQNLVGEWSERILELAAEQYQGGKLENAVAMAGAIPETSSIYEQAQAQIVSWNQEWEADEGLLKTAQEAVDQGEWQAAIAETEKIANEYWKQQAAPLIEKANTEISAAEQRAAERRAAEQRAAEQRAAEQRAAEQRQSQPRQRQTSQRRSQTQRQRPATQPQPQPQAPTFTDPDCPSGVCL
ncbi:protein kinase [Leptolyngbya sp. FACHB-541]|uniref:protein kinase domain-containing protein n=1 Tax=Leptolyngbya sp. FACHB-541 TaxID=2692810 RepID=UPI0016888BAC|nr:protein kinase [Leptolyngbya sp. FACHB-541]MBD1998316.1 protein kinase [Leptolyngbya sp. FACHB-541]